MSFIFYRAINVYGILMDVRFMNMRIFDRAIKIIQTILRRISAPFNLLIPISH